MSGEQLDLFEDNPEYEAFVEKFRPKKTTDDCYTPTLIYETVKNWACEKFGINPSCIVRPFYPGGDYKNFNYPEGCVVLDNPPFSIFSQICEFYLDNEIPFFLFAPSLTAFCGRSVAMRMNHIICGAKITYANGAVVQTAFVTSYGGDIIAQTAPDLTKAIDAAMAQIKAETKREIPKYSYPDHILTAAMLQKYSKYGVEMTVHKKDCILVSKLDEQAKSKKIFGGGLLLSDRAAAEKAAAEKAVAEKAAAEKAAAEKAAAEKAVAEKAVAEKAAAEKAAAEKAAAEKAAATLWKLSTREMEIVKGLSNAHL